MRIDCVAKTQTQWLLKGLIWRLVEIQKVVSPACAKHEARLGSVMQSKKSAIRESIRSIAFGDLAFDQKDNTFETDYVEVDFLVNIRPDARPAFDITMGDGTKFSHILTVEVTLAEVHVTSQASGHLKSAGLRRVLRTHFNMTVTKRLDMDRWGDETIPPTYNNGMGKPPSYETIVTWWGCYIKLNLFFNLSGTLGNPGGMDLRMEVHEQMGNEAPSSLNPFG